MRIEDEARSSVDSSKVQLVLLNGALPRKVKRGTFQVFSPVEPNARARTGNRDGAFVRFIDTDLGMWVEAPLGSVVAWAYGLDAVVDTPAEG